MSAPGCSQASLHAFMHPTPTETRSQSPLQRPRKNSPPASEPDEEEPDYNGMDFQRTEHLTSTQEIGDDNNDDDHELPQLAPSLSTECAALRDDFEIITAAAMENLYHQITKDINKTTALPIENTTSLLHNRIVTMNTRIAQLQQQVLTFKDDIQRIHEIPFAAPVSGNKYPKKKEEPLANQAKTNTNGNTSPTSTAVATATRTPPPPTPPDFTGWTTLKVGGQKDKKIPMTKLIPTTYPQAEREVTCNFTQKVGPDAIHAEQDYATRQIAADAALHRVNSVIVNNKDVFAPAFIRARVTVRGNIIFTTGNTKTNVIYEDYTSIIKDARSYYGKCEQVEIGKQHSQFLLHGLPTHLSLPEISESISSNYPQLTQSQTPRWSYWQTDKNTKQTPQMS